MHARLRPLANIKPAVLTLQDHLQRLGRSVIVLCAHRNVDGYREEDGRYAAFMAEISSFIPGQRQFTDPVRTFAYGTDASFYRLNPKLVVKVGGGPA